MQFIIPRCMFVKNRFCPKPTFTIIHYICQWKNSNSSEHNKSYNTMKRIIVYIIMCLTATVTWAQDVVIDRLVPGRLGITVLQQVNSFDDVRSLTIRSGKWNDTDLNLLQNDFPYLRKLDLGGLDSKYFSVGSIYNVSVGRKDSLRTIVLPRNLVVVPRGIISECPLVEEIEIPSSVISVTQNAFSNTKLRHVTFHEGLQVLGYASFSNCVNLERVTLPASLISASGAFYGCFNLYDVTCLAPTPPFVGESGPFGKAERVEGTLHIPPGSNYGVAAGWNVFNHIQEINMEPAKDIGVVDTYVPYPYPSNHPNVTLRVGMDSLYDITGTKYTLKYAGRMTVTGSGTLELGAYNHELDIHGHNMRGYFSNITTNFQSYKEDACWPTLMVRSPISATDVSITHRLAHYYNEYSPSVWTFTSLPFDAKLSDLVTEGEDLQWSIMKYSGKMRADARFDDVWVRQTADSTLHAGEGFIVAAGWNSDVSKLASIRFTATPAHRNDVFNTGNAVIHLHDYPAEFECDRGWNFVGNPYPCHFATKYFDLTGPFVVSDGVRFKTYSPIDDDYVLKPYEGFFIQKPWGHDALQLYKEGRFLSETDYEEFKKQNNAPRHVLAADRKVINVSLAKDDEEQDRTRLVINSEASHDYDPSCDAVKFPAMDNIQTELYLIGHDGTRFAISEQPLGRGENLTLGALFAAEGDYTISFSGNGLDDLYLTDINTEVTQPVSEPYTFHAQAGESHGRFYISRAGDNGGTTYQNATVEVDGVKYQINTNGLATVVSVTKEVETLEIPQAVTYQGVTYTVYYFNHYTNNAITYKHLVLPSTTLSTYISRGSPTKLESVTALSLCPPGKSYNTGMVRDTTDNFTYYVHPASVNRYKSSLSYRAIPHILPMSQEPKQLWAHYGLVQFDDTNKPSNKPDFYTYLNFYPGYYYNNNTYESNWANIEVGGTKTMRLGNFEYFIKHPLRSLADKGSMLSSRMNPTMIANSPMTADHVTTRFSTDMYDIHSWPMLCLPYDIRPSDITGDFRYFMPTVRRYDGAQRAANGVQPASNPDIHSSNWKIVSAGETISAGEGFIINAYVPYSSDTHLVNLPAVDNDRRNGIFANDRVITLKDYPSARPEDRGWNLVGNAYPAYYNMGESNISTPYYVWSATSSSNSNRVCHYYVFTRDDDDFLLMPFQAFFVQYTDTQHEIHMPGSGRYHSYEDYEGRRPAKAPRLGSSGTATRHLFDIRLTGCGQDDRTRLVLNEEAHATFEPTCDAIQMPAEGASLLCTIDGGQRYAVNERPAPQGSVSLGLDIATSGEYTLSLGKTNSRGLVLTDHDTGRVVRLDEGGYSFQAVAGRHDGRFTLSVDNLTHIGAFTYRSAATSLYDLQGRIVTGTPQRGIYIQNGKKVVIK